MPGSCSGKKRAFLSFPPPRNRAPGVHEETGVGYKVNGGAEMTEFAIGASLRRWTTLECEPAFEHGPGIVGDIGERSDAHPV